MKTDYNLIKTDVFDIINFLQDEIILLLTDIDIFKTENIFNPFIEKELYKAFEYLHCCKNAIVNKDEIGLEFKSLDGIKQLYPNSLNAEGVRRKELNSFIFDKKSKNGKKKQYEIYMLWLFNRIIFLQSMLDNSFLDDGSLLRRLLVVDGELKDRALFITELSKIIINKLENIVLFIKNK